MFQIGFQVLAYTNNSINILFYYLFSQKYRRAFKLIFLNKKKNDEVTLTNQTTRLINSSSQKDFSNTTINQLNILGNNFQKYETFQKNNY